MPPLALHTATAREIASKMRHTALEDEPGALYLGSTAPDIRILTRWDRRLTHFFDFANFDEQDGVQAFFAAYPELRRNDALKPSTKAFVAGYISHLVLDESWITDIYRPFFGERSPWQGTIRATIMDRAVQYELDRGRREDRELIEHVLAEIARMDLGLEIAFIDGETLGRWREVVSQVVGWQPDWEKFHLVIGRHVKPSGQDADDAATLLEDLPALVEETLAYVSPQRIRACLEGAVVRGLEEIKEYLCE